MKFVATYVAAIAVLFLIATALTMNAGKVQPVKCQEDSPCWNWRTMGNHSRGIYTTVNGHRTWCVLTAKGTGPYDEYLHDCTMAH